MRGEENIIVSLFAKKQGIGKIITKINEDRRAYIVEDFGIDSCRFGKSCHGGFYFKLCEGKKEFTGQRQC